MLICVIAGEPSGDALAARLMHSIKERMPKGHKVVFCGVGGENMKKEGLKSLFDITDLAVMGLAEVIPSIPRVLRRIKETVSMIVKRRPDVVITVDSWSFSSRVHKLLKKRCPNIVRLHYVAPQVWAWKAGRAKTMHKYIHRLLTLFPNEPAYFEPYNLQTDFIGHSAVENPYLDASPDLFYERYNISRDKKIVLILPGSRHNEVSRLLPVFLEAAKLLKQRYDNLLFVLPTVKTVEDKVRTMLQEKGIKDILLVTDAKDRALAARAAKTAMAASGTVSLELALMKLPHIIAYKVPKLTEILARLLLKITYFGLPNILLQASLVPELMQNDCTPERIVAELDLYLGERASHYRAVFKTHAAKLRRLLGVGKTKPSEKAAQIVIEEALKHRNNKTEKRK